MEEPTSKKTLNQAINRKLRCAMENQVQGSMEEQATKKKKYIPKCPAMSIDEYISKNGQKQDMEQKHEGDINYESDEIEEELNESNSEGAIPMRKRGKTLCLKIHARQLEERQDITLNDLGEPIGPDDRRVSEFTSFLGTIGRSSDFCPLNYTNWKALDKDSIWDYVNQKYIIPEKGKKVVFRIINDAWWRYKCYIKKEHFSKYETLRERLKNRPQEISEAHFKELMEYWRLELVQEISQKNAQNIAQQKWRHRKGPISFARIRERLRASKKDKEAPTQAEMFIETRQSKNKEKPLDLETSDAIVKLQDLIENSGQSSFEAFQSMFGKEKPGRVRCLGKVATPTLLKRNKEISEIEKRHANEVRELNDKIQEIEEKCSREMAVVEEKRRQEMATMDQKFQLLLKVVLHQNSSEFNVAAFAALLSTPANANSGLRSSASTHAPDNE
ncbi:uncharacterized protein LOC109792841, partial [Cajanus cajan]|uniref:uncharacterized protein LOC109792841 n=1 Tax=Cajanus cajan TaxID=3821 RepID=UPI00098D8A55